MSMDEQFLADLLLAPEDWTVRSVWADWCEDNDQFQRAACLRWMIRAHKRPQRGSTGVGTWFNADTINPGLGDPESDLPGPVYDRLQGGMEVCHHRTYKTLAEAERALHFAWMLALELGWKPPF